MLFIRTAYKMHELTLGEHPSRSKHKLTGEMIPTFPDQRSVRLNGKVIGYVGENGNIGFIFPEKVITKAIIEEAKELVEREFTPVGNVFAVKSIDELEKQTETPEEDE